MTHNSVLIESRLRVAGTIGNATIKMPQRGLQGIYRLKQANMFNSFYNVNKNNNEFTFDDGSGFKTIVLPDGSYSITTLLSSIRESANANSTLTFALTFDTVRYKVNISANAPFALDFTSLATIGYDLGFNRQVYSPLAVRQSESLIRLSLFPLAYYVNIQEGIDTINTIDSSSVSFIIPITTSLQQQTFYSPTNEQSQYLKFDRECKVITIKLTDEQHRPIELMTDYYLLLEQVC